MDLFKLLKQDHAKVNELFKKLTPTSDRALKTRERLCAQIKAELELHAQAEEAHFYPALRQQSETKDQVPEALKEHEEVRRKLAEIESLQPNDPDFMNRVKELQSLVRHHVREEEREIFPAAKEALTKEQTGEIAQKIEMMKHQRQPQAAE